MKFFTHLRMTVAAILATIAALYPAATVAAAAAKVYDLLLGPQSERCVGRFAVLGSNTLTGLIPTLYASLNTISREFVGFIPAVQRDASLERVAVGQTVTSPIAPLATAQDITPGVTAPNDGDQVFGNQTMTITKSRYVPIRWNGEEQKGLANGGPSWAGLFQDQVTQALRTLCNEVETDMAAVAYKAASRAYGTAGTTPFGTANDLSDFAETAKILDMNGAPPSRTMVVNANSMANLRGKQSVLFKANEAGTDELLRRGRVGMVEGFDIGYGAGIAAVTKGTGAGYLVNNAGPYAIGTTSIILDTGTGTVLAGDVVTFAGDLNKYVVATGVAAPGTIVINAPGLRATLADNVAMTVGNSFTPNVAFSKDGLVLATRMPAVPVDASGRSADMADDRMAITDPWSGISFEVALYRQYRQIKYEIGLAWGMAAANPAHVALLLG